MSVCLCFCVRVQTIAKNFMLISRYIYTISRPHLSTKFIGSRSSKQNLIFHTILPVHVCILLKLAKKVNVKVISRSNEKIFFFNVIVNNVGHG